MKHERLLADIRRHLRQHHGQQALGSVKLSTYLRHRSLHASGADHTHDRRPECDGHRLCACHHTH